MSQFTEFTSVEIPNKDCSLFRITEDLVYERWSKGSGDTVTVPKWFETDFAKPAIVHDYQWSKASTLMEYQEANNDFYDGMIACGMPKILSDIAYKVVNVSKYFYFFSKKHDTY
jgi:hypothetical protein